MKNFTAKELSKIRGLYEVVNKEEKTYTFTKRIPWQTGDVPYSRYKTEDDNKVKATFPAYLKKFENYYEPTHNGWGYAYKLKRDYYQDRPTMTITVKHPVYQIKLTEEGAEIIERRRAHFQKQADKYSALLGLK